MSEESTEARVPVVVEDNGPLSQFLDSRKFSQLYRVADMFSKSDMVPKHYHGNAANCMIAIEMAARMDLAPMMFMQNTYIVHGKPGIESKLAIALINSSGLFQGNLEYEREGDNPHDQSYRVRAFAIRKDTGSTVHGPWVDWPMVKAEKWGDKWKTMPGLMFDYRAAMFFGRTVCPERLMGMQTTEELRDTGEGEFVPASEIKPEKVADLIQLKPVEESASNSVEKQEVAEEVQTVQEQQQPEPIKQEESAPFQPNGEKEAEMRNAIHDLLAEHFSGDEEKMNEALQQLTGDKDVSIDQVNSFDPAALPLVLDAVEAFVNGGDAA